MTLLGGRSTFASVSSGAVPCAPKDIEIVDDSAARDSNVWTWTARCNDKLCFCSKVSNAAAQCARSEDAAAAREEGGGADARVCAGAR